MRGDGTRDDLNVTYTGNVSLGGPADVRALTHLTISKIEVGPHSNNAYLLRCNTTGAQALIAAANDAAVLLDLAGQDGLAAVITTHGHVDHWYALADVVSATGARTVAHDQDAGYLPVPTDERVSHGDTISFGEIVLTAIHLVGHTYGSIALVYDDPTGPPHLFTGDSLFPGGVGRTWDEPARFASLYSDVVEKIFNSLPDETWVYPGHGRDTTLGAERPDLADWWARQW